MMYKNFIKTCKVVFQRMGAFAQYITESEMDKNDNKPNWLDEFENLANDQLETGSSCHQIHPIVENWYTKLLQEEPTMSRDSVLQAVSCLSTELVTDMPDEIFEALFNSDIDYEDVTFWIQQILMIGRAFQVSLDHGELDDL